MGERVCLRCDWTGETDESACPQCRAALYRLPELVKPREVAPPTRPQPHPARHPISSTVEAAQQDESVLPAAPVASRGRAVIVGALTVVAIGVVMTVSSSNRTQRPANGPSTVNPGGPTAENIAMSFLQAYGANDADRAITFLADDADLSGWGLTGTREFRLLVRFNEATGFRLILDSCEETISGSYATFVRCTSDFHGLRSDELGLSPYSGGTSEITVVDGEIVDLTAPFEIAVISTQIWEPFADWVSTTYPEDAAVMYTNDNLRDYRLTPESIRLWEQHTREYVVTRLTETGPAVTAPPSAPAPAAPDVVRQVRCGAGARSRLELTDMGVGGGPIRVRFEVHRSPLGHTWRITLRRSVTIFAFSSPRVFFRGTRVASDNGVLAVTRRISGKGGPNGILAKARDSQTDQVCKLYAEI